MSLPSERIQQLMIAQGESALRGSVSSLECAVLFGRGSKITAVPYQRVSPALALVKKEVDSGRCTCGVVVSLTRQLWYTSKYSKFYTI